MSTPKSAPAPQADQDNRANQLNPDHDAYWQSRGLPGRPEEPAPQAPTPKQK